MVSRTSILILTVTLAFANSVGERLLANDGCVRFDIPAVVQSCEIIPGPSAEADARLPEISQHRLVELIIPVSTLVGCQHDQSVNELMIQVRSLTAGCQVVDYLPRTQMYSEIDGPIAVESRKESSASIGLDASGTAAEIVKLRGNAGISDTTGYSESYARIPEQKLLLASGTVNRGTGVYFKFQHSPQTTLEGGHDLSITLRVPESWRGGLLRIDCQAAGSEQHLFGRRVEFVAGQASFVVATWLKGDVQARHIVADYIAQESRLRQAARSWQNRQGDHGSFGQWLGYDAGPELPADWSSRFMLYDSRSLRTEIKPHLSDRLQRATDQFLACRRNVLLLSR